MSPKEPRPDLDTALELKKRLDRGDTIAQDEALALLERSDLLMRLLAEPKARLDLFTGVRTLEWRLLELCEIPMVSSLARVQGWLDLLLEKTVIPEGFSLTGKVDGVVACHSSLMTRIVMILRPAAVDIIHAGIQWILDYQSLARGETCAWRGTDLYTKWGGCMRNTPCYYGIVKAAVTLSEYQRIFGGNTAVQAKLEQALEAILAQQVYQRKSSAAPIEPSIIQNFYPYPYKTNLIEMLGLLKYNQRLNDPRCAGALQILKDKQLADGTWCAETSFMKSAWVEFDLPGKSGPWITHEVQKIFLDDRWTKLFC